MTAGMCTTVMLRELLCAALAALSFCNFHGFPDFGFEKEIPEIRNENFMKYGKSSNFLGFGVSEQRMT
jgi:hypothetical protein